MTLDNDHNPIAPHRPSDAPPRRSPAEGAQTEAEGVAAPARSPADAPSQSTDTDDATTAAAADTHRRAIVSALLSTLPAMLLPLVLFSLRLWCRAVGAACEAVCAPPSLGAFPSTGDQARDDAGAFLSDAHQRKAPRVLGAAMVRAAGDALYDTPGDGSVRVCELLSVVWFAALPNDIDATLCSGLAAEALADLDAFEAADGSTGRGSHSEALPLDGRRGAPRIIRCPLPAGVDVIATPSGVVLLPELPPDPSEANGRFDGPHEAESAPTAAELGALVHDAAGYAGMHDPVAAASVSAWVLQVLRGGDGECAASALAMLSRELLSLAADDALKGSELPPASPLAWRDGANRAAWGARVAARAARMCSAVCVGVNDVRDTSLPALAPWGA